MRSRCRPTKRALSLGGALLLAGCSAPPTVIAISASGLPADGTGLRVSATLNGVALAGVDELPVQGLPFGLRLPEGARGAVQVTLQVLTSDGCAAASGSATATAQGEGRIDLPIPLKPLAPHLCRLRVTLSGGGRGRVTSSGGQIQCDAQEAQRAVGSRCAADLPADPAQPIALRAEPESGSVFTGWTGPCVGLDPCALVLSGPLSVSASFEAAPTCSARTCWEHPLPQGNSLLGVAALSATDVWAVGRRGAILRYDGRAWRVQAPPPASRSATFNAVFAASASAVWIVGSTGTALRWDGARFNPADLPPGHGGDDLLAVTGAGPDEVWVVGDRGTALRYSAGAFSEAATGTQVTLRAAWASGRDDLWLAGDGGVVLQRSGALSFQRDSTLSTARPLYALWGAGTGAAQDLWAAGAGGTLWRRSGGAWRAVASNTTADLTALFGRSAQEVYALGPPGGGVLRFDGERWALEPSGTGEDTLIHALTSSGGSGGALWLVGGSGAVWQKAPSRGFQRDLPAATTRHLTGLFGRGAALFAVGYDRTVLRRTTTTWAVEPIAQGAPTDRHLAAVGGNDAALWAVGARGALLRRDPDGVWRQEQSGTSEDLRAIAASATLVLAVGDKGTVLRRDAQDVWVAETTGITKALSGVYIRASDGTAVAVGAAGTVLRRDPSGAWRGEPSNVTDDLRAVTGGVALWAAGGAVLLRFDGAAQAWVKRLTRAGWDLSGVVDDGAGGAWVQDRYHLVHCRKDGTDDELAYGERGMDNYMSGLWGSPAAGLFISGDGGAILSVRDPGLVTPTGLLAPPAPGAR